MTNTNLRPRKTRTKSGCVCCRLRRKKCDEEKPVCANCRKRRLVCSWLESEEFAWRWRVRNGTTGLRSLDNVPRSGQQQQQHEHEHQQEHEQEQEQTPELAPYRVPVPARAPSPPDSSDLHLSRMFLQFFIQKTSPRLIGKPNCPGFRNPLEVEVVRIAHGDSLIMHVLLALAGSHLGFYAHDPIAEGEALRFYVLAMNELKRCLTRWVKGLTDDAERLFLATVLLTQYEVISGNKTGAMAYHLRASRQFAFHIMYVSQNSSASDLVGVLLESYAYLELNSTLRFAPQKEDVLTNLSSFVSELDCLRRYGTFGALFGSAWALYETIPSISHLAILKQQELQTHEDLGCGALYHDLQQKLANSPVIDTGSQSSESLDVTLFEASTVTIIRNTLQIFLETAFYYGSISTHEFSAKVEPLVETTLTLLQFISDSPFSSTTFWPAMIMGAHARTDTQRDVVKSLLQRHSMAILSRGLEILNWLWDDSDESVFGLPGLENVVKAHGTSLCIG